MTSEELAEIIGELDGLQAASLFGREVSVQAIGEDGSILGKKKIPVNTIWHLEDPGQLDDLVKYLTSWRADLAG